MFRVWSCEPFLPDQVLISSKLIRCLRTWLRPVLEDKPCASSDGPAVLMCCVGLSCALSVSLVVLSPCSGRHVGEEGPDDYESLALADLVMRVFYHFDICEASLSCFGCVSPCSLFPPSLRMSSMEYAVCPGLVGCMCAFAPGVAVSGAQVMVRLHAWFADVPGDESTSGSTV